MSEHKIFIPKSKNGLLAEYPELEKYEEFKMLKPYETIFVWWHSCAASPIFNIDNESVRISEAYKKATEGKRENPVEKKAYTAGKIPDHVKDACIRMRSFNSSARIRAKLMLNKVFDNYEKILNVDPDDTSQFENKDGGIDWTKKKAFVDAQASIISKLPEMVEMTEHSFGASVSSVASDMFDSDEDSSIIENYVLNKEQ
jgi:hypothetical protein